MFNRTVLKLSASMAALLIGTAGTVWAQDPDAIDEPRPSEADAPDRIIVTSTRRDQALEDISRSVRVFEDDDLAKFIQQSTNVQEILGKVVPGFAPPVTEGSAGSLTLRGRDPLFLIDGVPVASNTNFSRFLDKFDPLTIGRVEVVYGPTSLYGAGATGGVIQFFTREPAEDGLEFSLGTQVRAFVTGNGASFDDDGISPKVNGSVSGKVTDWLSVFGYASFEDVNGVFRAQGDLLTGRSVFAEDLTFFGKARADITDNQSLTAVVNRTTLRPSDRLFELAAITADDGTQITVESPQVFSYAEPPTNEFLYTALSYQNKSLFGGALSGLFYYSDSEFLNPGSDIRALRISEGGFFPSEWPGLWQTGRVTEEIGLRGQYSRTFSERVNVAVGFDYNEADSTSLLPISSEEGFDETLNFDAASSGEQTPPFTLDAVGVFAETSIDVTNRLTLTGGVRWDRFDYVVEGPYEVTFFFPADNAGVRPGGSGASDGISYNVGATFDVWTDTTLFANFSQGFTIPSLGFIGNNVAPGVPVSDSDLVDPVITDSFEAGVRGAIGAFGYGLAGYYTESDFSTAVGVDPQTGLIIRDRAPTEIYGFELSADWAVTDRFAVDGSLTYVEGEVDPNNTGEFISLSTQDVPPLQFTVNPSFEITPQWLAFGQVFFVDGRDKGFEDGTDANPSEAYTLIDIGTTYDLDIGPYGGGVLSFQVQNLFNKEYIPAGEATFIPGRIYSGPGRSLTLSYQHTF
ncbi:MAG: TonB-dependent receptor [Pseudomonadota bacterium]